MAIKNKGFAPVDDNEADSLALLDFVLNYREKIES
jgi:hypothetical protein